MAHGQEIGLPKKRGRPSGREFGPPISLRLPKALNAHLDGWISRQPEPRPSRPEAIRRILADSIGGSDAGSIPLEDLNASNDE